MICKRIACAKDFVPKDYRQKYCSDFCMQRQKAANFRANNHASKMASYKRWYETHKEVAATNSKRWKESNSDKVRQYMLKYVKEHWDIIKPQVKAGRMRRRLLAKNQTAVDGVVTELEWQCLMMSWGHKCAYCGRSDIKLTQDHVQALSKGGSNSIDNIVPACGPCNGSKGSQDVADFLVSDFLIKRLAKAESWGTLPK